MDFIAFDHPLRLLLWPVLAALVITLGWRWLAALDPVRRWTAIALRLTLLAVVVLMLAGLQAVQTHDDLTVVALVDQSESVKRFASPPPLDESGAQRESSRSISDWTKRYLEAASQGQRPGDRFGWLGYDARPAIQRMPEPGVDLQGGTINTPVDGTNTAAAIRQALPLFPADSGARLVVVSDGNETAGGSSQAARADLLAAAREAKAAGIPIDVVPLDYRVAREAMVEGVYAPTEARRGQSVQVRVVLRATQPMRGQVQLVHDGQTIDLNGEAPGKGTPVTRDEWTRETTGGSAASDGSSQGGNDAPSEDTATAENPDGQASGDGPASGAAGGSPEPSGQYLAVKPIQLPLAYSGVNQFEAVFEPASPAAQQADRAANNTARGFTIVHGKGRILFVSNVPGEQGTILPRALRDRGIELDVVGPTNIPGAMSQLQRYDAIVLQNVPAERVTVPQQKMIAKYVNDLGGGFVMVGGPKSFGAGGWTNSPVDRILPVDSEIPSQTILPSGALALVIDRSGSMAGQKQRLANEAGVLALKTLYPEDMISVIAFDNSAKRIVPVQQNSDPAVVADRIRSIQSSGGTNIYAGLEQAYRELAPLKTQDAAVKHVILLTDGHSQQGNATQLARKMTQAGISLSTVGVGPQKKDAFLRQLAQTTGGRYHPVNNPNNLPQVFIKEARTIRKNLIKEEPFEPKVYPTRSPITTGLGRVPQLKGLVLTGKKDDPRVFMPILGKEGEPVFAHWQVGLGRAAAFTSDATTRWASDWVQWPGYGDFWASVMRRIARPSRSQNADLMTHVQDGTLRIRLDASTLDEQARFANDLTVKGSVLKPDQSTEPVTLQQTGPGVYETTLSAPSDGNYIVTLFTKTPEGQRRAVFGGATKTPGNELRRFESNAPLLERLADETGGRMLSPASPEAANLFSRDRAFTARSIQPMWRTLMILALALLLLDVANRRIAWEPRAIAAWGKAKVAALAALMGNRRVESERTLGALKDRREKAQQRFQPAPAGATQQTGEPDPSPGPAADQRFDVGAKAKPRDSFAEAVGAAVEQSHESGQPDQSTGKAPSQAEGEGESTGSRLRAAKQRTRQRFDSDSNENT